MNLEILADGLVLAAGVLCVGLLALGLGLVMLDTFCFRGDSRSKDARPEAGG